jgi:hypothetical protein
MCSLYTSWKLTPCWWDYQWHCRCDLTDIYTHICALLQTVTSWISKPCSDLRLEIFHGANVQRGVWQFCAFVFIHQDNVLCCAVLWCGVLCSRLRRPSEYLCYSAVPCCGVLCARLRRPSEYLCYSAEPFPSIISTTATFQWKHHASEADFEAGTVTRGAPRKP